VKQNRRKGLKPASIVVALVIGAVLATVTGRHFNVLGVNVPLPHIALPSVPGDASSSSAPTVAPAVTGEGTYTLMQEPEAGFQFVYDLFDEAKTSIDVVIYQLADDTAVDHLVAAHARGVTVRVILDKAWHGQQVNQPAYDRLNAAGVDVHWAAPGIITHQKSIVIDGSTAAVGTGNLTAKYYDNTRDAWVIDRNPAHIAAITATLNADLASPDRPGPSTQTDGLIWSPDAEDTFAATIDAATTSVDFQGQELKDTKVVEALEHAAQRGVTCRVLMTRNSDWYASYRVVTDAGCQVRVLPDGVSAVYIHEKTIVTDSDDLIIGSQNAGYYSLTRNRELSLHLTDTDAKPLIDTVEQTYAGDYLTAEAWTP
jgi:phosphatidylserine/phosphatidylglycerophosphate/cardiolipin synthase-like enzyme